MVGFDVGIGVCVGAGLSVGAGVEVEIGVLVDETVGVGCALHATKKRHPPKHSSTNHLQVRKELDVISLFLKRWNRRAKIIFKGEHFAAQRREFLAFRNGFGNQIVPVSLATLIYLFHE